MGFALAGYLGQTGCLAGEVERSFRAAPELLIPAAITQGPAQQVAAPPGELSLDRAEHRDQYLQGLARGVVVPQSSGGAGSRSDGQELIRGHPQAFQGPGLPGAPRIRDRCRLFIVPAEPAIAVAQPQHLTIRSREAGGQDLRRDLLPCWERPALPGTKAGPPGCGPLTPTGESAGPLGLQDFLTGSNEGPTDFSAVDVHGLVSSRSRQVGRPAPAQRYQTGFTVSSQVSHKALRGRSLYSPRTWTAVTGILARCRSRYPRTG